MTRDFEEELRRSLHTRAGDVSPDPAMFARVQSRIARGRMFRLAFAAAAGALAMTGAAVAAPALMDRRVEFEPAPVATQPGREATALPSERAPVAIADDPPEMVFTDGLSTYLAGAEHAGGTALWQGDPGVHCPGGDCLSDPAVTDVAVRPGSTSQRLSIVYRLSDDCGSLSWGTAEVHPGEIIYPGGGGLDDAKCATAPGFSPDGRHLGWLGAVGQDGSWSLFTMPWATGGPDGDATGFGIDLPNVSDVRLEDWVWTDQSPTEANGYLVLSADTRGERRLYRQAIERQGDGELALPGGPAPLGVAGGYEAVAFADSGEGASGYTLEVRSGERDWRIVRVDLGSGAVDEEGEMGLTDIMDLPDDVDDLWLSASGDTVMFGDGHGRAWTAAWTIEAPAEWLQIEDAVVHAQLLAPAPTVAPSEDSGSGMTVAVHFGMTGDDGCVADQPVTREVEGVGVARAALTELFAGPTSRESNEGIESPFNADTADALNDITIVDGEARVDLRDFSADVGTDSCTKSAILHSLEQTLRQFSTVTSTRYSFDGSVQAWELWLGSDTEHPAPPEGVANLALAIRQAAEERDYQQLRRLSAETSCTLSDQKEPCVPHWKQQEADGEDPLGVLADLLAGPPARIEGAPIWVWPADFAAPNADYTGPRIGIEEGPPGSGTAGVWRYYVQEGG